MNATILKFPIERTAGYSGNLPSLEEMYLRLAGNYAVLDNAERGYFEIIEYNLTSNKKAKIEEIINLRSIAWTMISRHGLNQERAGG